MLIPPSNGVLDARTPVSVRAFHAVPSHSASRQPHRVGVSVAERVLGVGQFREEARSATARPGKRVAGEAQVVFLPFAHSPSHYMELLADLR
jgi:hypothetical protein